MLRRRNKYKQYLIPGVFTVAIAASLLGSLSDIQRKSQGFSALSERANKELFNQAELELSTENIKKQQAISAQRIEGFGCRAMVNAEGTALASLRLDSVVTNRGVKSKLAPGNCVVGANGETAIIGNQGEITAIAAGKPEYAIAAIKKVQGAGKVYYYHGKGE
jgi:hypothetical protein